MAKIKLKSLAERYEENLVADQTAEQAKRDIVNILSSVTPNKRRDVIDAVSNFLYEVEEQDECDEDDDDM